MTRKRDRLLNYKRDAAAGKIDKIREEEEKNRPKQNPNPASTAKSESASSVNTLSDSALSHLAQDIGLNPTQKYVQTAGKRVPIVEGKQEDKERCHNCMEDLRRIAQSLHGLDIEVIVLADLWGDGFAACAFNPHFKKCKCDNCRHNVEVVKKMVSEHEVFE